MEDPQRLLDLLAAAEDEGGDAYAMTCLLGLNGLRVSGACNAIVTDLCGRRYQPTLRILGKGDKPAEIVLNPESDRPSVWSSPTARKGRFCATAGATASAATTIAAILLRLAKTAGICRRRLNFDPLSTVENWL